MRQRPVGTSHAPDSAVSPVIGMILVLAISVVGITGILYWGMPAVDEMKANVEAKSVQSQFLSLMADIQELDAGTAGKTAKRWQPTLQRGELNIVSASERWILALDKYRDNVAGTDNKFNFTWAVSADSNYKNKILVKHGGSDSLTQAQITLKAHRLDGTLALSQTVCEACAASPSAPGTVDNDWTTDETKALYLWTAGGSPEAIDLKDASVRIEIWYDGKLASQAWIMDMGKVHFKLQAGVGEKELIATNGGLIQGTNGNYVLLNSPPIPPPKETGSSYRMFARFIQMNGTASAAGGDRFDILVNLYGTAPLADYECGTNKESCVKMVKLYPVGTMGPVWRDYYLDDGNGYKFKEKENALDDPEPSAADNEDAFLLDWKTNGMSITFIHSVLTATG